MENWTEKLDIISDKVKNLLGAYHGLKSENETLKIEIDHLKVEVEQFKKQNLNINSEQTDQVVTVTERHIKDTESNAENTEKLYDNTQNSNRLKTQLDEIIEDLDHCIHIIQTTANGKK